MSNITSCDSGSFSTDNTNSREGDASLLLLNNNNNNKQQSESEILGGGGGGNFHSPNSNSSTITTNNNSSSNASNANWQPQPPPPPPKKKRSLPGNPDPSAEVIALSPNTLVTTNRFICEICNKGFQRDQNLQLHRRGHNLPWKLKQRSSSEVRKRVYVCPEPSCVHHNPSRALGDLTGIKKHFSRKHGDKKWKCDKCNKKYAVHSDWKAHSKICGTKEYKCDCGTVFSRRDSFITHRAFCDALADENNKVTSGGGGGGVGHFPKIGSNLLQPLIPNLVASLPITRNNNSSSNPQIIAASEFKQQHPSFPHHELMPIMPMPEQKPFINNNNNNLINPSSLPSLQLNSPHSSLNMFDDENGGVHLAAGLPHMSATALLQKAAQMGATTVSNTSMAPPSFASSNNGIIMEHFMHNAHQHDNNNNNFSVVNNNGSVGMNGVEMFNAILDQSKALAKIIDQNNRSSGFSIPPVMSGRSISSTVNIGGAKGNEDVMTLDFLGIGGGGGGGVSGGGDGGAHGYFGIGPLA